MGIVSPLLLLNGLSRSTKIILKKVWINLLQMFYLIIPSKVSEDVSSLSHVTFRQAKPRHLSSRLVAMSANAGNKNGSKVWCDTTWCGVTLSDALCLGKIDWVLVQHNVGANLKMHVDWHSARRGLAWRDVAWLCVAWYNVAWLCVTWYNVPWWSISARSWWAWGDSTFFNIQNSLFT